MTYLDLKEKIEAIDEALSCKNKKLIDKVRINSMLKECRIEVDESEELVRKLENKITETKEASNEVLTEFTNLTGIFESKSTSYSVKAENLATSSKRLAEDTEKYAKLVSEYDTLNEKMKSFAAEKKKELGPELTKLQKKYEEIFDENFVCHKSGDGSSLKSILDKNQKSY